MNIRNNRTSQAGLGAGGLLAVIVVVAVIGFVGWTVVHKKSSGDTDGSGSAASPAETMPAYAAIDNYVNVVQDDKTVKQATPAQATNDGSQARILQALHESCSGKPGNAVSIAAKVFAGQESFRSQDGYAYINASVCDPAGSAASSVSLTNKSAYLHRDKSGGQWVVDDVTDGVARCAGVEGKGYPFEIAQTCQAADGSIKALQE